MGILSIKRVYDQADSSDGMRILVDRLWPRGISKEKAQLYEWDKDVAPSNELRKWFGHDPEKYEEFQKRYFEELKSSEAAVVFCRKVVTLLADNNVTLVYGAADRQHNNAVVLSSWLGRYSDDCRKWAVGDPLMEKYHDLRWCRPVHEDNELFAMLCLEGQQAGLSWSTVIRKEADIRRAFDGFAIETVAAYTDQKVESLMTEPGIIHNRAKIRSAVNNAKAIRQMILSGRYPSFDSYIWHFTDGKRIIHHPAELSEIPSQDLLSETVSKDMKQQGFTFCGPVIIYSYLQGIGVIDDHLDSCPWKICKQ
jgi:DNA-3-methyladenine glycosylase I